MQRSTIQMMFTRLYGAARAASSRTVAWVRRRPRRAACVAAPLLIVAVLLASLADDPGPVSAAAAEESAAGATTQPTTQPSEQMFDPAAAGADPSWSMPAELSTDQVQGLVRQLDQLQKDVRRIGARIQASYDDIKVFGAQDLREALWQRLTSNGFRDPKVPLLYHEVMKDEVGFLQAIGSGAAQISDRAVLDALHNRIGAAQVRLLGGRCLIGDQLFIKTASAFIGGQHANYDEMEPKRRELAVRLAKEFPQFEQFRRNIVGSENPYLRLPGSEGYQRLPGATRDQ